MTQLDAKSSTLNTITTSPTASKVADKASLLHKLGLDRPIDLLLHLPLRYEDNTHINMLRDVRLGDRVQIEGKIVDNQVSYRGRRQLVLVLDDGTGSCVLRFFNFYPNQQRSWAVGTMLRARGEIKSGSALGGWVMLHPTCSKAGGELATNLTPIYSTVAKLSQNHLQKTIAAAWQQAQQTNLLQETIPAPCLANFPWPISTLTRALNFLHYPTPEISLAELHNKHNQYWTRLKAEELLAQQLSQQIARRQRAQQSSQALVVANEQLIPRFMQQLTFQLTTAQHRVIREIRHDLLRQQPMHRLLQGDVGSGKTVVAAISALHCIAAGWQAVLMVPTEILAQQHVKKLVSWLQPLGIQITWLLGSQKLTEKRQNLAQIATGQAQLIIGTHAVIQQAVQFAKLGLVIIDEQQRFGVAQRLALRQKKLNSSTEFYEPHFLMMSATPIPRTLAMSYYADLDVSSIDELPPGRKPIVTKLLLEDKLGDIISRIANHIKQGKQVYWVCPLIEESEVLDLANATDRFNALAQLLPQARIALLHSKLPAADKQQIMHDFANPEQQSTHQLDLLVATTVIEVGVDVPNASLMVIEQAERFGLSQLHQLRGRIGRGSDAAVCVLLYSMGKEGRLSQTAKARLKAMLETQDGFEIARRDLAIRGPGEILGAKQAGVPLLRFADLTTDIPLLDWARQTAQSMLREHPQLVNWHLHRWLGEKTEYIKA